MGESLTAAAEDAIGFVVEGTCPLCRVGLRVHDERACCPCCGDSYVAALGRLEITQCGEHGRFCEHWEAVWATRSSR
jgi:hypothetical protein